MGMVPRNGLPIALFMSALTSACMSELVFDNYKDGVVGGASSNGTVDVPPSAGGVTSVFTSLPGATSTSPWAAYGAPDAPVGHMVTLSVEEPTSATPILPTLVASLKNGNVLFSYEPTVNGAGFAPTLAEYSPVSGTLMRSTAFPDAFGPSVMSVDSTGSIVLAGKLGLNTSYGGPSLQQTTKAFYLVKLDQDWNFSAGLSVAVTGTKYVYDVMAIATDASDNIYVALALRDSAEHPLIVSFDSQLQERYRIVPTHSDGFYGTIASLSVSPQNELLVSGRFSGTLTFGDTTLTSIPDNDLLLPNGWLARFDITDGKLNAVLQFGSVLGADATGYLQDSPGNYRVGASLNSTTELFGQTFDVGQGNVEVPLVVSATAGMTWEWGLQLGWWFGRIYELKLSADGRLYVVGEMYESGAGGTQAYPNVLVYGAEITSDGAISSFYGFPTTAPAELHVSVGDNRSFCLSWSTQSNAAVGSIPTSNAELRCLAPVPTLLGGS